MKYINTQELLSKGDEIILEPTHSIDWYLQDYERPDDEHWEKFEPKGREWEVHQP